MDNNSKSIWSVLDDAFGTHHAQSRLGENGAKEHTMYGMAGNNTTLQGAIVAANGGLTRTNGTEQTVRDYVHNILHNATPSQKQWATATCLVMGMNLRDTRGGKGEKDLSRWWFKAMYDYCPQTVANLVMLFPEYGYWKDLVLLLAEITPPKTDHTRATQLQFQKWNTLRESIYSEMVEQFLIDRESVETGKHNKLSLLVKYIPKEGRSFDKKYGMSKALAKRIYPDVFKEDFKKAMSLFRHDCSTINAAINTTETLMSAGLWDKIQFKLVPSACLFRNKKAFLNEKKKGSELRHPNNLIRNKCRENLRTHVELALQGKVTISGKQLGLHEFVGAIMANNNMWNFVEKTLSTDERKLIVAQWNTKRKELIKNLEDEFGTGNVPLRRIITMIDTSGSMWSYDNAMPAKVGYGVGIMMSEVIAHFDKTLGNRIMTYDSSPTWVEFKEHWDFIDKVKHLSTAPWGGATNYIGAHQLLLDLQKQYRIPNNRMPTDILVVSDMQFNGIGGDQPSHEQIKQMYKLVDCPVPNTTYWNVRTTGGSPVQSDTTGTQYISGFSLDILKYVLNAGRGGLDQPSEVTPWHTAMEMITDRRYELVHKVIETTQEKGVFDGYVAPNYDDKIDKETGEVVELTQSTVEKELRKRITSKSTRAGASARASAGASAGAGASASAGQSARTSAGASADVTTTYSVVDYNDLEEDDDESFEEVTNPSVEEQLESLKAQLKAATEAIAGLSSKLTNQ